MTFTYHHRFLIAFLSLFLSSMAVHSAPGDITTVAGIADPNSPYFAGLNNPTASAVDSAGNLYIADLFNNRIRKVAIDGRITTMAGTGVAGYAGDGGPATSAQLYYPSGLSIDTADNLYIADRGNHRIRKIASNGIITTVAGTGAMGDAGDDGLAVWAELNSPYDVSVDGAGNLYIADTNNFRIRKVAADGTISTVAGTGVQGDTGSSGIATSVQLSYPEGVDTDSAGNLYIADSGNHRVRKVTNGMLSTVAGTGVKGNSGSFRAATSAQLNYPTSVSVDGNGDLYIADSRNFRIRKVSNGRITPVVGIGFSGYSGDGGAATLAYLGPVSGIDVDSAGNLYLADQANHRIRKVADDGRITTVAGTYRGFSGDDGDATSAQLHSPYGVTVDRAGNLYIADRFNQRIRKVNLGGMITTLAGTGVCSGIVWANCASGDNRPATTAQLDASFGIDVDDAGNVYTVDENNDRVRKIASSGLITTVIGTTVGLKEPRGMVVDHEGNIYVADSGRHSIYKLTTDGVITIVAGIGTEGFSGDDGRATLAQFFVPQGMSIDSSGNLYIADTYNHRIRKIASDGTITTVAGTGAAGDSGDNGQATLAQLNYPADVAVDDEGNLYIVDYGNHRIRKVAADGVISTVAGTGSPGYSGDNGPAALATLASPSGISVDAAGNLYIADTNNHRIRKIEGADTGRPTGSIVIDNASEVTNTTAVELMLSCDDDSGCAEMWLSNDALSWERWAADVSNANSSWNWDWSLAAGADGVRHVYVYFVDVVGKTSETLSASIRLDTTAPNAPQIVTPSNNTLTKSTALPELSGVAETDASVTLKNNDDVLGITTAINGQWRLNVPGLNLDEGVHSFSATATDFVGNTSPSSVAVTYTVDATPPEIILLGANPMTLAQGSVFSNPGSLSRDNFDDGLNAAMVGSVDTTRVETYRLTYSVSDHAGNLATPMIRVVHVTDQSPPELIVPRNITVVGDLAADALAASNSKITTFLERAQANDNVDGVLNPTHDAPLFFSHGTVTRVTFTATDSAGLRTTASATVTVNAPLASGGDALASSGTGFTITQSEQLGLDPAAATTDTDADGIVDSVEVGDSANPYDSDNDGLLDVFEAGSSANDASSANGLVVAQGTVTIASANEALSNVSFTPVSSNAPAGLSFPFGVIAYTTTVSRIGETKTVQLTFSSVLPVDLKIFKVDASGKYSELENGASKHWQQIDDHTVELRLTDGDPITDLDGIANGIIVDPIALADASQSLPTSADDSSGGGGVFHPGLFLLMVLLMRFAKFQCILRK